MKKENDPARNEHLIYIEKLEKQYKQDEQTKKELHRAYIQLKLYDDIMGYE